MLLLIIIAALAIAIIYLDSAHEMKPTKVTNQPNARLVGPVMFPGGIWG